MATSPEIENREPHPTGREASASERRDQNGCCGGPAPEGTKACCALDAELKSGGRVGVRLCVEDKGRHDCGEALLLIGTPTQRRRHRNVTKAISGSCHYSRRRTRA